MDSVALSVPRSELVAEAGRLLKLAVKSKLAKSELVMDFAEDSVALTLAGTTATLPAVCSGSGRVFASGLALKVLKEAARNLVSAEVSILVDERMLHVGRVGVSCWWVREPWAPILLPLNATLVDVLELRYLYSQAEIVAAGLERTLFEAEDRKARLIANATETLAPLGVSVAALDHLVTERIKEVAKRHDE